MLTMKKPRKEKKKKWDRVETLVETSIIQDNDPLFLILDNLCFLSKNVYNCTLYAWRQAFIKHEKLPNYNYMDKYFRDTENIDYNALPQKVSQQSIKLAFEAVTSYFALAKKKNKEGTDNKIGLPRYLDSKTGRQTVMYTSQAVSVKHLLKDGYFTLSCVKDDKGNLIQFKTRVKNIQFVRISHHGNHIVVEVGHRVYKNYPKKTGRIAAIDLGINNIATLTTNFDSPIIFNGKPIKYINHEYNEQIAKNQSSNACCNGIKDNKWTHKMHDINLKRTCRINDYFHKLSRTIVNYLVSNHISILIIGKNDGWKQNTNMGKVNNQNFVQIPFNKLIELLIYKCELKGIQVFEICESHTSKCSFIDNEDICHHDNYIGSRETRDLFYTENGICINADVNGSYNIMKRWCQTTENKEYLCFNKYNVCKNPKVITLKLNGKKCDIGEYIDKTVKK